MWLEIEGQAVTTFPFQVRGLTGRGAVPWAPCPRKAEAAASPGIVRLSAGVVHACSLTVVGLIWRSTNGLLSSAVRQQCQLPARGQSRQPGQSRGVPEGWHRHQHLQPGRRVAAGLHVHEATLAICARIQPPGLASRLNVLNVRVQTRECLFLSLNYLGGLRRWGLEPPLGQSEPGTSGRRPERGAGRALCHVTASVSYLPRLPLLCFTPLTRGDRLL